MLKKYSLLDEWHSDIAGIKTLKLHNGAIASIHDIGMFLNGNKNEKGTPANG